MIYLFISFNPKCTRCFITANVFYRLFWRFTKYSWLHWNILNLIVIPNSNEALNLESLNKHQTYLESNVSSGKYTNGSRHYSVTAINIKPRCSYSMLKGLEFDIKEFPCFVFLLQQIDFEMKYKRNIRLRKWEKGG